ncbi:MAG: D-inositol-3-phosphate glycosyltransferase, partial [Acidimicrobiaceae bacterium]|nr:D-inositol-3-phosphate glycosyltransferase [Acidimicrobiaceae bacterium]
SGHALKHRLGLPLVTTFHTLGRAKASSGELESPDRIIKEQDVIDCSEVVVANSSAEAGQLQDLYGASPERISIVPLGVQHAFFAPGNKDAARSALGLVNGPIITYVGRLQPLKGVELAIEMFSTLEIENATLLIVGGASGASGNKEIAMLKQQVKKLGIESQVHLIEPQPHHILGTFYRASDVVIVPSRSESFGLVALEAAACGTPVVTAAVGGLRDLVIHGETGFLVEQRDPKLYAYYVNKILQNPLLSAEIAMSATENAQQYSWSKTSDQILNIYNSVTSKALVDCR